MHINNNSPKTWAQALMHFRKPLIDFDNLPTTDEFNWVQKATPTLEPLQSKGSSHKASHTWQRPVRYLKEARRTVHRRHVIGVDSIGGVGGPLSSV
ncbi:hypothetical protein PGTUg99_034882 [Puccinia graminis f. sp. tritici]|uniref:Uncharacterized protein n=1 Tax=Puccinia graminis f. sp. tritici TaxID=56615 RepID=A0A5B0NL36_PUCGR|nr:hypothetical protein PGTUg99_034882 [Puccinia graminis f. sp. tritici]